MKDWPAGLDGFWRSLVLGGLRLQAVQHIPYIVVQVRPSSPQNIGDLALEVALLQLVHHAGHRRSHFRTRCDRA